MAPETSRVIKILVDCYLDNSCFKVVEGGFDVAVYLNN